MTTNNQCNHAEAIAREMHMYYAAQAHNESNTPIPHWADLTENEQQGWIAVANTALPIIGKHALEDVRAYLGLKASGASTWWKRFCWAWPTPLLVLLVFPVPGLRPFRGRDAGKDGGMQRRLLPGAGTGAYLLQSGPACYGRSAHRANTQEVKACVSSPKYRHVSWILPRLPPCLPAS